MGTPQFSVPVLEALLDSNHTVVAVVTGVDKPAGRKRKLRQSAVKQAALEHNLPILQPEHLDDPVFLGQIATYRADVGVVVAFQILPAELYSIPDHGCVNLHTSMLPDLRGAAPINWALMRGYTKTGVTTFQIERKVDTGQILLQQVVKIAPDDDVGSLSIRMSQVGAKLMVETLDQLATGAVTQTVQQGKSSSAPKITTDTCLIDWSRPAEKLHNQVRGLSPIPTARTYLDGKVLKLFRTTVIPAKAGIQEINTELESRLRGNDEGKDENNSAPGTAIGIENDMLLIQTGNGTLGLIEVQLEGKKRMNVIDFMRGKSVPVGTMLE